MHAVSLLVEVYASSAKQGEASLWELSAWADHVWVHYCTDVSDSSLTQTLKPAGWQDHHYNLSSKAGSDRRPPR